MIQWLKRYWPILVALFWLGGYEIWAALTNAMPTISEMVWTAPVYVSWIVIPILVLLVWHFWFGLWAPQRRKSTKHL